jgi:hypothetical protein
MLLGALYKLLSSATTAKVCAAIAPSGQGLPYIVFEQTSGESVTSFDGNNRLQHSGLPYSISPPGFLK